MEYSFYMKLALAIIGGGILAVIALAFFLGWLI